MKRICLNIDTPDSVFPSDGIFFIKPQDTKILVQTWILAES